MKGRINVTGERTTIINQNPTLEERIVEEGLDWLMNNTELLDGYSYGVDDSLTHARWVVVIYSTHRGDCYGTGATLIDATNNALDVLGGECECDDTGEAESY